jgi:hypothetical protein
MREALRKNPGRAPVSLTTAIPAPVKGWFAQESYVDQDEKSAVIMENFFPGMTSIQARRGSTAHATGMTGDVPTLMVYTSATESKLFAVNGGAIYDISAAGAVPSASLTGLANDKFQWLMMANSGAQYLYAVNGADNPQIYTSSGGWSAPVITGVDATTFVNIALHKKRLWFVPVDSTDLYYLSTDAIAGAATVFPVGAQFHKGGYIMACGTWSVDAGDGMDDMFVVVSSEGECSVYAGTDPSSASDWALIGNYHFGKPLGRRCLFQVGGDLLLISEDGLLPVSDALKIDRAASQSKALTKNIRDAYAKSVARARSEYGWQLVSFSSQNRAYLNIPGSGTTETQQYVLNTLSGAWCNYTGWDALTFEEFDNALYFGATDGTVYRAEYGATDNSVAIPYRMLPAWNHLKAKGRQKIVSMVKPVFTSDVDVIPAVDVAVDYEDPVASATAQDVLGDYFTWDVSNWDEEVWRGVVTATNWRGGANIGSVISPFTSMDLDASGAGAEFDFQIVVWEVVYELGGVL